MVDRVSTKFNFTKTIDDFQRTQSELTKLQTQISTGNKAASFSDLGSDVSRTIDLAYLTSKTNSYLRENNQTLNRLKSSDLAIKQIMDIGIELRNNIVAKRSGSPDSVPLGNLSDKLLASVKDRLNTSAEGRFIFAGSKVDIQPVDNITGSNIINGAATDTYYVGDNVDLETQVSDQLTVKYGIRANDAAFKNIIGALNKAKLADSTGSDAELTASLDLINQSVSELAALRNSIGNNMKIIEGTNSLHTESITFYERANTQLTATDIPEATIKVSLNQTILQASFQVFARLSNLKLVNFLN